MCYKTTYDIELKNRQSGRHFFEPGTMRFFNSRILEEVYGGHYFVTSERQPSFSGHSNPRTYTLRYAHTNGDVDTVGDFARYSSAARAKTAARKAAAGKLCGFCNHTGRVTDGCGTKDCDWCSGDGYR